MPRLVALRRNPMSTLCGSMNPSSGEWRRCRYPRPSSMGSGAGRLCGRSNGGYFENEGLQTALDLAEWLAAQSTPDRPVLPIIVQATGDGEADVTRAEVMTCDNVSDGPFIPDD